MYFLALILFLAIGVLTIALPNLPNTLHSQALQQTRQKASDSLGGQRPIPTGSLLAGVLDNIEEDYGDLGGEKPVVRARKGVWWALGWRGRGKAVTMGLENEEARGKCAQDEREREQEEVEVKVGL